MENTEIPKNAYYLKNKEKLNHNRLGLYHKKKNHIPVDKLDTYLQCRSLYNNIIKNKNLLDLEFIKFLLQPI